MAVTASFSAATGVLTVLGDNLGNNIAVSRDAAGQILINGGAVAVLGDVPTVANTALIQMFGQGDNDTLTLDESNGSGMPHAWPARLTEMSSRPASISRSISLRRDSGATKSGCAA